MSRGSLDVIKEFLRFPDSQPRKNALTALGALETEESMRLLATSALDDSDESVRSRAEDELAGMRGEGAIAASKVIHEALAQPDRADRAYALLGRLRQRGWVGVRPAGGFIERTRRANRYRQQYTATLTVINWATLVGRALLGGCLGMVSLLVFVGMTTASSPELWEVLAMLFYGCATASLFLVLGVGRSAPLAAQADRTAAVLVEIARALVAGLLAGFLIAFIMIAATPRRPAWGWWPLLGIPLGTITMAVGVRALGFSLIGLSNYPRWNRKAQAVLAATGAIVLVTGVLIGFGALDQNAPTSAVWVTFVVATAGLSNAVAGLEGDSHGSGLASRPVARGLAAAIVVLIILPAVVLALLTARGHMSAEDERAASVPQLTSPGQSTTFSRTFNALPIRLQFEVDFSQTVLATIHSSRGTPPNMSIEREGLRYGGFPQRESQNSRMLNSRLMPGSYTLIAETIAARRLTGALPAMQAAVAWGRGEGVTYKLDLTLNADRSFPPK